MKLAELLKTITPLPWDGWTAFPTQGKTFWDNQAYRRHAANTLPALLEAARLSELNYKRTNHSQPDKMGDDEHEAWTSLQKAIAAAENVKDL